MRCFVLLTAFIIGLACIGRASAEDTRAPVEQRNDVAAENQRNAGTRGEAAPDATARICAALGSAAAENGLPLAFFTRLIWQESRFDPQALSPAGAQGIAQFMPRTAAGRGLADPFEPTGALQESAQYLRELLAHFGNRGLAAAAYNAGPRRVQEWLAGTRGLPRETIAYVRIVTGHEAEEWAGTPLPDAVDQMPRSIPCTEIASLFMAPAPKPRPEPSTAWGPWGVQLIGNRSEQTALAGYARLKQRYAVLRDRDPMVLRTRIAGRGVAQWAQVRVAADNRQTAEKLCSQLRAAGGACMVLKTPRAR